MTTAVGIFADRESAENAVPRLIDNGIDSDSIGILMRDSTRTVPETVEEVTYVDHHDAAGREAGKGVVGGAIGGATATGGTVLLASAGVALIPGIGALLAAGTVAATAAAAGAGAVGGATVGGILGAILGAGDKEATKVTEEQTRYREVIEKNGVLVSVDTGPGDTEAVVRILEAAGAERVNTLSQVGDNG